MRETIIAFIIAVLLLGTAVAQNRKAGSENKAVTAVVHQFVDSFNKGDMKTAAAACADQTSIIDEFPPHEWHGSGACAKWMDDYDADAKKNGITDGKVTLGAPRHVDVSADRAYVVVPADYVYKQKSKPVKETASMLTVALQKIGDAWKITSWAWSKH
jgi:ketosteroid isomerase-like protein